MRYLKFFILPGFLIFNGLNANINLNDLNVADKSDEIKINRKFVVFVPSYNNEKLCEKNIQSILDQTYENYRVIYVNDASTDKTGMIVHDMVERFGVKDKFTIINNDQNQKVLANMYKVVHELCLDDEIIVNLDGDDFFAHPNVLEDLNAYYQSDDVWVTWGSYTILSTGERGEYARPIAKKILAEGTVRKTDWSYSHLRSFYVKVFKHIEKEHFLMNGKFPTICPDPIMMHPLIELAGLHAFYIPEVLYMYNDLNPIAERHDSAYFDYFFDVIADTHSRKPYSPIIKRDW
jgi:cellulose synthase/poly-beta-1,6-N-acetylglucosamine synthase-like glycosyltransferase